MNKVTKVQPEPSNIISVRFDKTSKFHELQINTMMFLSPDKNRFYVPMTLLKGININEFPKKIGIMPYDYVYGNHAMFLSLPIEVINVGNDRALVKVESCKSASEFTDGIGVEAFQALKKGILLLQTAYDPKIDLYFFDKDNVHLHYNIVIPSGPIDDIVNQVAEFDWLMAEKILTEVPDTYGLLRAKLNLPNPKTK